MRNKLNGSIERLYLLLKANRTWIYGFFIVFSFFSILNRTQWSVEVRITKPPLVSYRATQLDKPVQNGHQNTAAILSAGDLLRPDHNIPFDSSQVAAFVKRFAKVAKAEQTKFGLPASVSLAISLMRSESGTHSHATEGCNYFGLKAGHDWPGAQFQSGGQRLRRYNSAWASWRDFSLTWQQLASDKKQEPEEALEILRHSGILTYTESVKVRRIIQLYKLEEIDTLQF